MTWRGRPSRRSTSIRVRLLAGLIAVLVVGLVGNFVVSTMLLDDYLRDRDRETLLASAERVERLVAQGPLTVDAEQMEALLGPPLGALAVGTDGNVIERTGSGETLPRALVELTRVRSGTVVSDDDADRDEDDGHSLLAVRVEAPGLMVVGHDARHAAQAVILTIDTEIDDGAVARLVRSQALLVVATAAAAVLLALLALRVGLRPLMRMSAAAEAIASGARSARLPEVEGGTETTQLARAVNRAFDAQAEAEEKIRAFAADASHELRTPLATISGWLDLHHQGGLPAAQLDRALERIDGEAGRMRLLVEELSLLARLDAGRALDDADVDVAALAGTVVEDARVVSQERTIDFDRPAEPALVRGDELRLGQVLRNLVGNAVQHTPPSAAVRVRVDAGPEAVVVRVHDEGPGIPAEQLARIFERFWRADASRSRAHGGSGLGLAIVEAIVQAHGGTTTAESGPGRGSTFTVTLPVARR